MDDGQLRITNYELRTEAFMVSMVMVAVLALGAAPSADLYVASTGNDSNPGTEAAPFASLERTQVAVRARIASGLDKDLTVLVRGGTYRLAKALRFGPEDSGTAEHSVTYAAYPGEVVVVSGGRPVTGWRAGEFPNAPDLLRVECVTDDVRQIVVNNPLSAGDLAGQHAELVMYQNWSISRVAIVSTNERTIQLANPMGWIGHGAATTASPGKPTYVENALAFVDQPGEWYLDYDSGRLTYQGAPGEDPNKRSFVAPVSDQLVVVEGRADAPVRNLHFQGLTFAHTHWDLPSFGYMGIQAGHYGTSMDKPTFVLPAAIEFTYAQGCGLDRCRVAHTGACGIVFGAGTRNNKVHACELSDVGGNGIMVGWRGKGDIEGKEKGGDVSLAGDWTRAEDAPVDNEVVGNMVTTCGAVNHGCVGIFAAFSRGAQIAHNVVYDMPYTGISVGFRWDESETSQRGAIIEYNHVYDTMKMLADGGCLYTLGYQPGTIIRGNVFHDAHRSAFAHGGAPNNGIFFDQGSKGYRVEGNTIYNTSGDPVRFNQTSKDNMTWENNSLGVGTEQQRIGN
ncbi:MAG: right-handed parallel beta-helix repeat-containing protein [Candidatus Hydrogenedentes bacterium]|nr:right-handed parallel beta-helix repeat-containing protein [Candidatus Hydrogenedentota bacterium]